MILRSEYAPSQQVRLNDADLPARVIGVLLTDRGISYICRWWDGENFQENEFGASEITSTEERENVVVLCGAEDVATPEEAPAPPSKR